MKGRSGRAKNWPSKRELWSNWWRRWSLFVSITLSWRRFCATTHIGLCTEWDTSLPTAQQLDTVINQVIKECQAWEFYLLGWIHQQMFPFPELVTLTGQSCQGWCQRPWPGRSRRRGNDLAGPGKQKQRSSSSAVTHCYFSLGLLLELSFFLVVSPWYRRENVDYRPNGGFLEGFHKGVCRTIFYM